MREEILNRASSLEVDEEDEEEAKRFHQILDKFKTSNDDQDLGNTEQHLLNIFNSDSNVCLICIESIGNKQAIWNCGGCFALFHLNCIQNWIRDGSYLTIAKNFESETPKEIPWNCPKCRKEYQQKEYPSLYYCFCRKVKDPKFDPWGVPHSCQQKCNKTKPCSHTCLMLCHPGPCPPCPTMVQTRCFCGKSEPAVKRCANRNWSCSRPCNKLLKCKQHLCEQSCHPGECDHCQKTSIQFCRCKKNKKQVLCTQTDWQCEQECLKPFECGFHKCELKCHSGTCGPCPRSLVRTCPCGKTKSQKPCNVEIGTCGDTCNKQLECGLHKCANRCHFGPCEQCRQEVVKKCRCRLKEKSMPCYIEFTCETKCNRMRPCGKHKCNKKCCDGNCPPCEQLCNKLLGCKNHKCKSLCHQGPCYPCPVMEEISCPCGSSKIKIPCVKSKSNIRIPCKNKCNLVAKCHHEKIQTHRCHYGECPACKLKCDLGLKCGHKCQQTCHSYVLTEIVENKIREGPWVPMTVRKEYLKKECGDCMHPIPIECLGGHEISDLPCYAAKPFNCGRKCARQLACGHHTCELECHQLPKDYQKKSKLASSQCKPCERECEQKRPCEHECSLGSCHPASCPPCTKLVKLKCHCDSNFVYIDCHKWTSADSKLRDELKSCRVPCPKSISCGHNCTLLCHSGKCSLEASCQTKVNVKCACKTLKKSFQCNQLKLDSQLIEIGKSKQLGLKCNDKCELKKKAETKSDNQEMEESDDDINIRVTNHSYIYIGVAILFLLLSIIIYKYIY